MCWGPRDEVGQVVLYRFSRKLHPAPVPCANRHICVYYICVYTNMSVYSMHLDICEYVKFRLSFKDIAAPTNAK